MPPTSLLISANAIPRRGGQGLNFAHMIEGLSGPFDVSAFCGQAGEYSGAKMEAVPPSQVAKIIGRVPVLRRLRDWQSMLNSRAFDRHVAGKIARGEAIAEVFQGVTGQCVQSLSAARRRGMITILDSVTAHIDDFIEQQRRECACFGIRPSIHRRQVTEMRREYELADLIRVMSDASARSFVQRGVSRDKIVVVPPIMSSVEFPDAASFSSGTFRISFVGLLEPWKGFHYLIDAFDRANLPDAELVLWGGSGSRPVSKYLAERTARNLRIVVKPVEVRKVGLAEVYGKSHVLVHPSLTDGFGYVVGEAMASGIPVITTTSTGASQLVEEGRNGFVLAPRDVDALIERLRFLSSHRELLPAMGAAARASALRLSVETFRENFVPRILMQMGSRTANDGVHPTPRRLEALAET